MTDANSTPKELLAENESLRLLLEEAQETLRAIGSGEVDAFVASGPEGDQVFILKGAEQPYRVLVETMNEGAATLTVEGIILYCNNRLAAMMQIPLEKIIGTQFGSYVAPADLPLFTARLEKCTEECVKDEIVMIAGTGTSVQVLISCCAVNLSGSRNIGLVVTDITQQKLNVEIRAAEILSRSIIEQAGEAIIVCDEEGRIIRASRLAHDLCGENLLLKTFNELFKLRIPETENLFSVVEPLNDSRLENVEVEFRRNDDQIYHLVLNAAPLKCDQDRINGCVVTLTDISERKRAEEALRQSEEKYRMLFNSMLEGFCIIEVQFDAEERPIDYRFLETNLTFETQTGLQNVQGKLMSELAPENEKHWFEIYGKVALTGESARFVDEAKALNRWFDVSAYRIGGVDSRKVAILFNDITEAKRIEDELRQSEFDLQVSYIQIQVANVEIKAQSEEVQAQNEESERLWGKAKLDGEILRKFNEDLEKLVKERTKSLTDTVESLLEEITNRKMAEQALIEETSKRLQAMEVLREKEQMLIQQNRQAAMGEMIGNIAHQWRQPLNTLGLYIQSLQLYFDSGLITKELVDTTTSNSMRVINHMSHTIDDFRNYFAPNKDKVEFSVGKALSNTLSLMEGSFQSPKIDIEIDVKDDAVIYGYQSEFAQVLLNIIINARDALIEKETVDPRITITICRENGCSVVTIADNAGGIPEEILDKIFDPYFTTKDPQKGTGVGLFMSKSIIEMNMRGSLAVRNANDGAEFRIEVCNGPRN